MATARIARKLTRRSRPADNGKLGVLPVKSECALIIPSVCESCGQNANLTIAGDGQSLRSHCETPGCKHPLAFTVMITKGNMRTYLRRFRMPPGQEA